MSLALKWGFTARPSPAIVLKQRRVDRDWSGSGHRITLVIAVGRIYTKISKFHRLFVDDGFFILATILLMVGTALQQVALPYGQTPINVGAGVESPPPDLVQQLVKNLIFQTSSIILLYASVSSVKFSFLFFFRLFCNEQTDFVYGGGVLPSLLYLVRLFACAHLSWFVRRSMFIS